MTPEDEITLARGLSKIKDKYERGNAEHAGKDGEDIQKMSSSDRLKNIQDELMDAFWYIENELEKRESKK